eukprot:gnl/TRDRNA2_/TRDRNA2_200518_c0_seq1.p1 gnl/TRDRNA2_/TRDRNA2_200518_c0~~gnl/TRDRNA2_/TRDRNA2_200518_c0_seq1.p1  ORF type:complete len:600 (+),score=86.80 gnl/TRDRNA2_/TRDRNA2_200518_c0_seq1:124-1923(+)
MASAVATPDCSQAEIAAAWRPSAGASEGSSAVPGVHGVTALPVASKVALMSRTPGGASSANGVRPDRAPRFPRLTRAKTEGAHIATPNKRTRRKLYNMSEQRVLKDGILQLHRKLNIEQDSNVLELPRRSDGSPKMLRASFYERLLSGQIELQSSMANDVAAAQSDLKHLSLAQLLALRSRSLDFATESRSHDAHNNFLATLDRLLFERFARQRLCDGNEPGQAIPKESDPFCKLGHQMLLVLGVARVLVADDGSCEDASTVPLPRCWALTLDAWSPGCSLALFDAEELKVQTIGDEQSVVGNGMAAVVWDRSSGKGKDRVLNWEVSIVDTDTEDLRAEVERARRGSLATRGSHGPELAAALLKRQNSARTVEAQEMPNSPSSVSSVAGCTISESEGSPSSPGPLAVSVIAEPERHPESSREPAVDSLVEPERQLNFVSAMAGGTHVGPEAHLAGQPESVSAACGSGGYSPRMPALQLHSPVAREACERDCRLQLQLPGSWRGAQDQHQRASAPAIAKMPEQLVCTGGSADDTLSMPSLPPDRPLRSSAAARRPSTTPLPPPRSDDFVCAPRSAVVDEVLREADSSKTCLDFADTEQGN